MSIWRRLQRHADDGGPVRVAVNGAGFMARGLVRQLALAPGLEPVLVVNRTIAHGVTVWESAGRSGSDVIVSDSRNDLEAAIERRRPAVTDDPGVLAELGSVDVVVEATGALDHGARVVLDALAAGKDVVSLNAELDATIGHLLHHRAERASVVYTICDGDQPGVLLRQLELVAVMGIEVVAAVNCKANLDVHQNPDDSRPYAERDGTSPIMTTAFGDGTKMQIEQAVVANATGLVPERRGMVGVRTTLTDAAADVAGAVSRSGVVEYTLGGDFRGGVFVVGRSSDPAVRAYLKYSKLGDGPEYLFYRPYHLMHFEVPRTVAEVVLDRQPLSTPEPAPVAEVVAIAKRALRPGDAMDGIGGFTCYGHVDTTARAEGFLPIGLAHHARVVAPVALDEPVPLAAVEIDESADLVRLRREQDSLYAGR